MRHAEFAFPGPLRGKLVAAILSGAKTSTTGLLAEYEHYGEELPQVGERSLVLGSDLAGVAVIETTEVRVIPLCEVELRHAVDEGEGFTTVAQWRADHSGFWQGPEVRAALGDPEFTVDDMTKVVTERFRLLERIG
ncbi:ASCH domain-containing protein [Amycolatopsis sp. H20-H5]|uniref:ASCH domain-containing protein n=1 Tax=Amycolatopsis sp. H20-H5 TaxID=3046309 RepID=UPI002DB8C669|nr:ASCH domain-containing protein [Amycolatopsis sp. H20-H5]MEC3975995.1 ASCH domain-containing protein [Amycolatopsis sp. H20-H5]